VTGDVVTGRAAFARHRWTEAYEHLSDASEARDLERLAIASHMLGLGPESFRAWEQAYGAAVDAGDHDTAIRCAGWLATQLLLRGDHAKAEGWLARGRRTVGDAGSDDPAHDVLQIPTILRSLFAGDGEAAAALAARLVTSGRRSGDPDLLALGLLASGQANMVLGDVERAMPPLDEAMLAVTSGDVSPMVAGIVYCAVIETCMGALDMRRAAEWTDALHRWCMAQPDMVSYRGQCLVHRSQVLQAHGAWDEAISEAEQACIRLAAPPHPALGLAWYQRGELLRMRGVGDAAELAYRAASEHGYEPAPGLALLRLAQGKLGAAVAAIRRMVDESSGHARPVMLAACTEIMLASGDERSAAAAADELAAIAGHGRVPLLHAIAGYAGGAVELARSRPADALGPLRRAAQQWRDLEMPYDAARARVLIGLACRALGDRDAEEMECEAARATFERLGAEPDLRRLDVARQARSSSTPLTERQCEVLAAGHRADEP
jgi:tetratricopeptide (TPR) repeat protein